MLGKVSDILNTMRYLTKIKKILNVLLKILNILIFMKYKNTIFVEYIFKCLLKQIN